MTHSLIFFFFCGILTSGSTMHVETLNTAHPRDIRNFTTLPNNETSLTQTKIKKCLHNKPDGTPSWIECPLKINYNNKDTTEKSSGSTDTEVVDLTSAPERHHGHTVPVPKTEDTTKSNSVTNDKLSVIVDEITQSESKLNRNRKVFNTTAGAIAAVICVTLALASYIGIMVWKNVILRRYQNREILLNEDDLGDINDEDMRHFEAACIQIET